MVKFNIKDKIYPILSSFCTRNKLPPIGARTARFGEKMQNTLIKIAIVLGLIDFDLQGQIKLKSSKFIMPVLYTKYTITTKTASRPQLFHGFQTLHVRIHLDRFTVPTVSRSQPSACVFYPLVS